MDKLEEKISSLIVDYMVKSNSGRREKNDFHKLATFILSMLKAERIDMLFDIKGDKYSDYWDYHWKLDAILQNIDDRYISWNDYTKKNIFQSALTSYFSRITSEIEATATARESWKLKQRIIDLEAQVEFGKPAESVTFWDKLNTRINIPYLILLCLSAVLIGGLTLIGLSADMTVNVEFNIGEILGALLIGTGVAAAGISYATKDGRQDKNQDED